MKVYFAGMEKYDFSTLAKMAGVRSALFTCFGYICGQFNIKWYSGESKPKPGLPNYLENNFERVIMDSGLFTLMFGSASKTTPRTSVFLDAWQDALVAFVQKESYNGIIVEVDCQKILGVAQAWVMRERLAQQLSNQIINVVHLEDGIAGLDRLIEYSNYIAISIPELRFNKVPNLQEYVKRQCAYIRNKKPEIKIHLLGCTELTILAGCKDLASSSDSTSWQCINRYGTMKNRLGVVKTRLMSRKEVETQTLIIAPKIEAELQRLRISSMPKDPLYLCNYYFAMLEALHTYTKYAGSQK